MGTRNRISKFATFTELYFPVQNWVFNYVPGIGACLFTVWCCEKVASAVNCLQSKSHFTLPSKCESQNDSLFVNFWQLYERKISFPTKCLGFSLFSCLNVLERGNGVMDKFKRNCFPIAAFSKFHVCFGKR